MCRLIACFAAALLAPAPANAVTLLARYEPVTIVHPHEVFLPQPVDSFLARAQLEQRLPDGSWAAAASPLPSANPAGCASAPDAPCLRLNLPACTPQFGVASFACYTADEAAHRRAPVVYGAVLRRPRRIVLEYWYWYSYDYWSGENPPTDFVWQAHEGDWEEITVVLDARARPLYAGYSEHTCGKRRAWSRVPKWRGTSHPIAFVALGSHVNSYSGTTRPIDLRPACYPQVGGAIIGALLHPPLDWFGSGIPYGPPLIGVRWARIVRLDTAPPAWAAFPGAWGEGNYFHAPDPVNTRLAGASPVGPRFHAVWRDPIGTVTHWPRG